MSELVRNGGFERGDTAFWEAAVSKSFEVSTTQKKYGTYSGKLVSAGGTFDDLITRDYIPVTPNALYHLSSWVYGSVAKDIYVYIAKYDTDHNLIDTDAITSITTAASWQQLTDYLVIPEGVSYIRIYFKWFLCSEDDILYVDAVSLMSILAVDVCVANHELFSITDETTKQTVNGTEFFSGIFREAEFKLSCTSLTGTAPTLDVKIQAYDPTTALWEDVLVFQQLTAAGTERKVLQSGVGWKLRAVYTTGGTAVTDCDFKLGAILKR